MNLTWKKLSEKKIRINRFRTIIKKRFLLPNGNIGNFYTRGGHKIVCALVLTKNKKVVLAKQFRTGVERVMWELPGGAVNPHEAPVRAIAREVLEETGYRGKIKLIGVSSHDAWSSSWRYHYLITNAVRVSEPENDAHEVIEPVEVSPAQLIRLIQKGKLTDSETAYRASDFLGWLGHSL